MSEQHRAALIKQSRRGILDALLLIYPVAFSFESLASALLHLGVDDDVLWKDVFYLVEKGYLECTNSTPTKSVPRDKRMYRLTPSGNEIANRLTDDAALTP